MKNFAVPTRENVSANNQAIFDNLQKGLGFVPNIYATLAHNETALGDYLSLQNRKSTLKAKEKEVVNLVVSQVNGCRYCQSAHTALGKMHGFSEAQILEIRSGSASFNAKLDALATFTQDVTINRGKASASAVEQLFAAGYNEANMVDIIVLIGDKIITNFLHGVTNVPIDFPVAPELEAVTA